MKTPADPFLAEAALAAIAASDEALPARKVAAILGEVEPSVLAPLGLLVEDGLVESTPRRSYLATDLGRQRVAEAMTAEMQGGADDDADALVAAFTAMAPTAAEVAAHEAELIVAATPPCRAALVASMNSMAPSPALHGWTASARFALQDYERKPSRTTALRARRMLREAIFAYDPAALPPADPRYGDLEDGLVASVAARRGSAAQRTRRPTPEAQKSGCCGTAGTCRGRCGWPPR